MSQKKITFRSKFQYVFFKVGVTLLLTICPVLFSAAQITLHQTIGEDITPKSIVHDGRGLFSAQNMMYKHTISLYTATGTLLKTIPDQVNLHSFGYTEYENTMYKGAPVEACFTPDGKYLWVSNYAMYGPGFNKEGCDACSGDQYDPSFLYKINTITYEIESVVKVGSVPKYITISHNGKLLLVSNWTSSDVSIIDLETEQEIRRVKVGPRPRGIVVNKINQKAYVAIMGSNRIAVINLLDFSVKYIDNVGKAPRHLILSQDNHTLFAAVNSANSIVKIDLLSNKIMRCKAASGPRSMVLTPDEKFLYVVNYYANSFQKINVESMFVEETVQTHQKPIGIAGDWKNARIWVSCYSGKISIYNDKSITIPSSYEMNDTDFIYPRIKLAGLLLNMELIEPKKENMSVLTKANIEASRMAKPVHKNNVKKALPQADGECQYNVIVGSFSIRENAKHLQDLLATQALPSITLPSVNNQMTMVSVGSYNNSYTATSYMRTLKSKHDLNSWIYKQGCR